MNERRGSCSQTQQTKVFPSRPLTTTLQPPFHGLARGLQAAGSREHRSSAGRAPEAMAALRAAAAAAPPGLAIWDEFGNVEADRQRQPASQRSKKAANAVNEGSRAAQQWLTALARHCESAEGARAKAGLMELLRCGSRSRDKTTALLNRARNQIGAVFRQGGCAAHGAAEQPWH